MTVYKNIYDTTTGNFVSSNLPSGKDSSMYTLSSVQTGSQIDLVRACGRGCKKIIVGFGSGSGSKSAELSLNDVSKVLKREETRADSIIDRWGASQLTVTASGTGSGAVWNSYEFFGDLSIESLTVGTLTNVSSVDISFIF